MDGETNLPSDPRRLSRFLAIQYLFTKLQEDKNHVGYEVFEPNSLLSILEEKKYNTRLYEDLIVGTEENTEDIDDLIRKYAPAWPLEQINPVDLVTLRVAIYEAFIGKLNPVKVVINEAVDISKALSSDQSGKFVNGVLGAILNDKVKTDGPASESTAKN